MEVRVDEPGSYSGDSEHDRRDRRRENRESCGQPADDGGDGRDDGGERDGCCDYSTHDDDGLLLAVGQVVEPVHRLRQHARHLLHDRDQRRPDRLLQVRVLRLEDVGPSGGRVRCGGSGADHRAGRLLQDLVVAEGFPGGVLRGDTKTTKLDSRKF